LTDQPNNSEEQGADPGVGGLLRASRLRVGEDLPDIARMLCIRCPYLEAIEDGRYEDLPGSTYAAGFVRSYAEHLGLDADEVVRRFKVETSDKQTATRLDFPVPVHESGVPSGAVLFIGLLIAAVGYGLWFVSTGEDNPLAGIVSRVPGDMAAREKVPALEPSSKPNPGGVAEPSPESSGRSDVVGESDLTDRSSRPLATRESSIDARTEPMAGEATEPATTFPGGGTVGASEPTDAGETVETAAENGPSPVTGSRPMGAGVREEETATSTETEGPALSPSRSNAEEADGAATEDREAPMPWQSRADAGDSGGLAAESTREPVSVPEDNSASIPEPAPEPDQKAPPPWVVEAVDNGGTVYGRENMNARIIVRAIANSYIQVRDEAAGEVLIARLLVKGDSYLVPNRDGLKLLAGNAGGIEILVDGENAPSIGSAGIVRRGVVLDATRLKNGSAVER